MIPYHITPPAKGGPTTFELQKKLPKIPVPRLEDTCTKLLQAIRPFASEEEFQEAEQQVIEVLQPQSPSQVAQQHLINRARSVPNYLSEWWLRQGYLDSRGMIAPVEGMVLDIPGPPSCCQHEKAAMLLVVVSQFYDSLLRQQLGVGGTENKPVCMDQYRRLLLAHRIAQSTTDAQVSFFDHHKSIITCHAVIICKGQHFKLPLGRGKRIINIHEARSELEYVSVRTSDSRPRIPIGTLQNGLGREEWANTRANLRSLNSGNRESFETLESAAFVLCLDDAEPVETGEWLKEVAIASDPSTRCYDHCCQWIVFRNGKVGYTFEHSQMDAIPSFRLFDEVSVAMEKLVNHGVRAKALVGMNVSATRLVFNVPPSHINKLTLAEEQYRQVRGDWLVHTTRIRNIGKTRLNETGLFADALIQLAFQAAYFSLYRYVPSVYESVATVSFLHGRTETCRPVSTESVQFVIHFQNWRTNPDDASLVQLQGLLHQAAAVHRNIVSRASSGEGFDRHVFALQKQLELLQLPVPKLFNNPAVTRSSSWELSTSHVVAPMAMRSVGAVSFHPVGPFSTGITYGKYKDHIDLVVMNNRSGNRQEGDRFANQIVECLKCIVDLATTKPSSSL